jgi:hypothetical protein
MNLIGVMLNCVDRLRAFDVDATVYRFRLR